MSDPENKNLLKIHKERILESLLLYQKSRGNSTTTNIGKISEWCSQQGVNTSQVSDEVFLVYLYEQSSLVKLYKLGFLW